MGYLLGILRDSHGLEIKPARICFLVLKVFNIIFPPSTKEFTDSYKLIQNITDGKSV